MSCRALRIGSVRVYRNLDRQEIIRASSMMKLDRVSIARLKASLSTYLAKVEAGESLVITDRGLGVAVLTPVAWKPGGNPVDALVMSGQVTPPSEELGEEFFLNKPTVKDPDGRLRAFLEEDRSGGW